MKNVIRIGVLSQPELPKQLESIIEAIFREQFRKLCSIFGPKNIALVSSIEIKVCELACIAAVEGGLNLELEPFEANTVRDDREAKIKTKIHNILKEQPVTNELDERISEMALAEVCDIIFFVFDKSDPYNSTVSEKVRKLFSVNKATGAGLEKLIIFVNCPKCWSADADGEVYFEYVTRITGPIGVSSEVEIPDHLIKQWSDTISAMPH